ncbi:MAG: RNA polymerase factor sigma-54 [Hyphomicrobiaceae bacterium]|nr:RNA polymerase factor sigma-54 [Hyphomicrobiaceae bacterium]
MALSTKLEFRQGQQLVMTPQLQQAIRLLQLSNIELAAYVETEMERNPLLEHDGADDEYLTPTVDNQVGPEIDFADDKNFEDVSSTDVATELARSDTIGSESIDADIETICPDASARDISSGDALTSASSLIGGGTGDGLYATQSSANGGSFDEENFNLESYVAAELSLRDHLLSQAGVQLRSPADFLIGQHLIDMVDEAGYVRGDFEGLADKLGTSLAHVERVLLTLQTMDPPGVCARTLSECLAAQLRDQNRFDPIISKLLANLHLLASHNIAALKRAVDVEQDELVEMIAEIRSLDPKPGLKFGSTPIQPVVPDVFVRPARDGSWHIELNTETLPRVLVNRSYYTLVSKTVGTEKDKTYLFDCLQSANWLVKSLDQRARTILKVAEEIVRQQDGFLTHGVQHLRPLNLKTVADKIKMHESTVSRVTSNKYVATPRGIFELKYFFTSAISASDAENSAHSSESVRHRIKQLVDAESISDILSDDKLVERLKDDGIDIARRTIAKYREALKISSSVQRRREKQMLARLHAPQKISA